MKLRLTHGDQDLAADVIPDGDGFKVTLGGGRAQRVEGSLGSIMRVRLDGRPVEASVRHEGLDIVVELHGHAYRFRRRDERAPKLARRQDGANLRRGEIHAPMPGLVVDIHFAVGDEVEAGQPVLVVEAMKMQNALTAPVRGVVTSVPVAAGMAVDTGQLLVAIRPAEEG